MLGSRNTLSLGSRALGVLAAVAAMGCDPGVFADLGDEAPVVAFNRPSGFGRTGFGATVASVEGRLSNGEVVTRIAVGAGPDAATWTYEVWNVDDVSRFHVSGSLCEVPADDCVAGTGSALVGLPAFGVEGACFAIGEAAANQVRVFCLSNPGFVFEPIGTGQTSGLEFGAALAAVPAARVAETSAALVVGAPAAMNDTGAVYFIPSGANGAMDLNELTDSGLVGPDARLGSTLATALLPDTSTLYTAVTPYLLAVSAPGENRVILAAVGRDPLDATQIDAQIIACVDGAAGIGGALVADDVDGDGLPEVYIGFDEGASTHPNGVSVLDLADLRGPGEGCEISDGTDDPPLTLVDCPTVDGVDCDNARFGSALALGDVDADGTLDLVAGAPSATVDGKVSAGAVFVVAGSASGLDGSRAAVMRISSPSSSDRLGASVATVRTHLGLSASSIAPRHEVLAGAPGTNAAYLFLCSGLGDDVPDGGDRCLELPAE